MAAWFAPCLKGSANGVSMVLSEQYWLAVFIPGHERANNWGKKVEIQIQFATNCREVISFFIGQHWL
jgi:hypothetical protein